MVEIREETDDNTDGQGASHQQPPRAAETTSLINFLKSRQIDALLWVLRLLTVVFGFLYIIPIMGVDQQMSFYSKTLLAGAATNAIRLYQRLGGAGFQFNREFFSQIFLEDACHYLFYCILFLGSQSATMVIMPVLLFAILHANNFTVQVLDGIGMHNSGIRMKAKYFTDTYASSLLNVIACTEIFIMPMVVVMIFMGRCSLFVPFVYYRFLTLRYMSRRNPNTRFAFYQIRMSLEQAVNRPTCPAILRNGVHKVIGLVSRLAPQNATP